MNVLSRNEVEFRWHLPRFKTL